MHGRNLRKTPVSVSPSATPSSMWRRPPPQPCRLHQTAQAARRLIGGLPSCGIPRKAVGSPTSTVPLPVHTSQAVIASPTAAREPHPGGRSSTAERSPAHLLRFGVPGGPARYCCKRRQALADIERSGSWTGARSCRRQRHAAPRLGQQGSGIRARRRRRTARRSTGCAAHGAVPRPAAARPPVAGHLVHAPSPTAVPCAPSRRTRLPRPSRGPASPYRHRSRGTSATHPDLYTHLHDPSAPLAAALASASFACRLKNPTTPDTPAPPRLHPEHPPARGRKTCRSSRTRCRTSPLPSDHCARRA